MGLADTVDEEPASEAAGKETPQETADKETAKIDNSIVVKVNGKDIRLSGKDSYIYVDVFEYIDFDLSKPQGRAVVTKLNDRAAIFNEQIRSGDVIEIYWSET
jgi:hypothetical protein